MGKFIDLEGQKFNRLLVIKLDRIEKNYGTFWECLCDCGNKIICRGSSLRNKETKSCGCLHIEQAIKFGKSKAIDISGQRFGRLIAIERAEIPFNRKTKGIYWLCKCDCGKYKVILKASLIARLTLSCGCFKDELSSQNGKKGSIKHVQNLIEKRFGKLVVKKLEYINCGAHWFCVCNCGNTKIVSTAQLNFGCVQSCGCLMSEVRKRGKEHWNWQGGKTSKQERIRKSNKYFEWRTSVFERDNYTCQNCGKIGCELNAHHIKSFSEFSDLIFDIDNGITLCVGCHKKTDNYGEKAKNFINLND